MRGAAPSIVCPRCEQAAPPANTVGQFTTCTKCGMTFDAAPRERLRSFRKRAHDPAPVCEDPDRPIVDDEVVEKPVEKPARKPGHLSGLQIIGILVAIFAIAWIKVEFFPSEEQVEREREIAASQREHQRQTEESMRVLRGMMASTLSQSGIPACAEVARMFQLQWNCPLASTRTDLAAHLDLAWSEEMERSSELQLVCKRVVEKMTAMASRRGCF